MKDTGDTGTESSGDVGLGGRLPEDDTLLRKRVEARVDARVLGGEPALPRIDRFVLEGVLGAGGMGPSGWPATRYP